MFHRSDPICGVLAIELLQFYYSQVRTPRLGERPKYPPSDLTLRTIQRKNLQGGIVGAVQARVVGEIAIFRQLAVYGRLLRCRLLISVHSLEFRISGQFRIVPNPHVRCSIVWATRAGSRGGPLHRCPCRSPSSGRRPVASALGRSRSSSQCLRDVNSTHPE